MFSMNSVLSGNYRVWAAVFFGLIFACCPLLILLPGLSEDGDPFFLIFVLPFALVGLGFVAYGFFVYTSRYRVGKPEVIISNQSLRVGESFNVNLQHTFRSNLQVDQFQVQLQFRETATYQQGTDTRTVFHNDTIENYELPAGQYRSGQFLQENFEMKIPEDGMHTVNVRRNRLQWFVRIHLRLPKMPDYVDEYEVTVLPEIMR